MMMFDPETPQPIPGQVSPESPPRGELWRGVGAAGGAGGDGTAGDATVISQPSSGERPEGLAADMPQPVAEPGAGQPVVRPTAVAATGRAAMVRRSVADLAHDLTGRQLEHFLLEELIGGGGMGAVFRGRDVRLDRVVAVKVMPAADRQLESYRRFRIEAQSAARLDHPHIARVYYIGESADWNYIVFEFIEGVNLRDWVLRMGPLEVDDALCITRQIAEALQHAFDRHVVHRDIKPSNILLTPAGVAKLVDMGLARTVQLDRSAEDVTLSGVTLGTFDYIAPEQARDPRQADVRSDLYSLGCTLYFLLTASPPFSDAQGLQKLISHSQRPIPDPRLYRGDLPDDLVGILGKLMAKRPADRYAKPLELVADIQRLADTYGLTKTQAAGVIEVAAMPPAQRSLFETLLPWGCMLALLMVSTFWLQNLDRLDRGINLSRPQLEVNRSLPTVSTVAADTGERELAPPGVGELARARASSEPGGVSTAGSPVGPGSPVGSGSLVGPWGPPALSQPSSAADEASDVRPTGSSDRLQSWLDRLTGRVDKGVVDESASEVGRAGGGGGLVESLAEAADGLGGRLPTTGLPTTGLPTTGLPTTGLPTTLVDSDASVRAYPPSAAAPQTAPRSVWLLGDSPSGIPPDALIASNWQQAMLLVERVPTIQRLVIGLPSVRCQPLSLPRSGLTIEAAPGLRPTLRVALVAEASSGVAGGWLDVGESSLRLQRLDIEVEVSGDPSGAAPSLFRIGAGGRLYLGQCGLSLIDLRGAGQRAAVVTIGSLPAPLGAPLGTQESSQRLDEFPFDVQIHDSIIRGSLDLLVAQSLQLGGRVQWDNGLLAIDGWMVRIPPELAASAASAAVAEVAEVAEVAASASSPLLQLDLHQLTLYCRAGWAAVPLDGPSRGGPWLMREATRCRFQVGPGQALVKLFGPPSSDAQWLASRVTFRGGENVYFLDEGRLIAWADAEAADRVGVGPLPDPSWLVAEDWAAQFLPPQVGLDALPLHRATPADYRWSGEVAIGHQLSRLPAVAGGSSDGS
jgi:serine/threonine protein kinase